MNLKKTQKPANTSWKQFFRELRDAGEITRLQLRAIARAMNRVQEEDDDVDEAAKKALALLQKGELPVAGVGDDDPPLVVEELAENLSPKQKLLELRRADAITPIETRKAAKAMDDGASIEDALVEAGAERVVTAVPPLTFDESDEGDGDDDGDHGGDESDGEEEDDQDEGDEDDVPFPKTLEGVLELTVADIRRISRKINSIETLEKLIDMEKQGQERTSAIDAFAMRIGQIKDEGPAA